MKKINKQLNPSINYTKKSLQDNIIDKNEYESLCNIFTEYLERVKNESFFKI